MLPRFFAEQPISAAEVDLGEDESHHLIHVLRSRVGDKICVFDGQGGEFEAEVIGLGKRQVRLRVGERLAIDRESSCQVHIAVSLPKGDRQKVLVEKLTELGARELVPLLTQRAVAQPTGSAISRLRRQVVAASKQCGRNELMTIAEPATLGEFIQRGRVAGGQVWLAHPAGDMPKSEIAQVDDGPAKNAVPEVYGRQTEIRLDESGTLESNTSAGALQLRSVWVLIGPEGGFTADEYREAIAAGAGRLDLGPRILRVETAALASVCRWTMPSTDNVI